MEANQPVLTAHADGDGNTDYIETSANIASDTGSKYIYAVIMNHTSENTSTIKARIQKIWLEATGSYLTDA